MNFIGCYVFHLGFKIKSQTHIYSLFPADSRRQRYSFKTVKKCLPWLIDKGLLKPLKRISQASHWEIPIASLSGITKRKSDQKVPSNHTGGNTRAPDVWFIGHPLITPVTSGHDVWQPGGLNKSGWIAWSALQVEDGFTLAELEAKLTLSPPTIRRRLRQMEVHDLVRCAENRWYRVDQPASVFDKLAEIMGTAGRRLRREQQHLAERRHHHRMLHAIHGKEPDSKLLLLTRRASGFQSRTIGRPYRMTTCGRQCANSSSAGARLGTIPIPA
jgi:hypothetical protein